MVVVFLLLALLWGLKPLPDSSGRLQTLALETKKVVGRKLALSEAEKTLYSGCKVSKRLYTTAKDDVIVALVEASNDRHAVHDPSYCLVGAGWSIESRKRFELPNGEAEELLASHPKYGRAAVLYWYTDGRTAFRSTTEYWWRTSLRRLTMGRSGQEPILVLLSALSPEEINWSRFLLAFPELRRF